MRISLSDFIPGALDVEDAVRVAQTLETDGQIDYVNVTAAGYHNIFMAIQPSDEPDGYLVDLTSQVKAALAALPVFTVGGIKDPVLAEEIIAAGKADMVAMTRAQIADPGVREQGGGRARGRDHPLHPRQPGLHRPGLQGAGDLRAPSIRRPAARAARARCRRPSRPHAGSSPAAARPG